MKKLIRNTKDKVEQTTTEYIRNAFHTKLDNLLHADNILLIVKSQNITQAMINVLTQETEVVT